MKNPQHDFPKMRGGGGNGRLELFQKFIRFRRLTLPLMITYGKYGWHQHENGKWYHRDPHGKGTLWWLGFASSFGVIYGGGRGSLPPEQSWLKGYVTSVKLGLCRHLTDMVKVHIHLTLLVGVGYILSDSSFRNKEKLNCYQFLNFYRLPGQYGNPTVREGVQMKKKKCF